jgi:hypothetical protein
VSKRLEQTRTRAGVGWRRNRNLGVEQFVPHQDVEALYLLDQKHDRSACCCDLSATVVLKAASPPTEDLEFLRVKSVFGHGTTLLPTQHLRFESGRHPLG